MPEKYLIFNGVDATLNGTNYLVWNLPQKMLKEIKETTQKFHMQLISAAFNGAYAVDNNTYEMQTVNILSSDIYPLNYSSSANNSTTILGIMNITNVDAAANFNCCANLLQDTPKYELTPFDKLTISFELMSELLDLTTITTSVSKNYVKLIFKITY